MRILLTNDDGICAPGIRAFLGFALTLGDVLVAAPETEQSACSHSITLRRPFRVLKTGLFDDLGVESYSIDSTPADCVRFAVDRLGHFDFVISGINRGYNIGHDIAYSGTCAAACEANYAGIKSMSCSTDRETLEKAAGHLPRVWDYICEKRLYDFCDMLNVNIPGEPKGILITKQGGTFYRDHFDDLGDGTFSARLYMAYRPGEVPDYTLDTDAILAGYCTISPLAALKTDTAAYGIISRL